MKTILLFLLLAASASVYAQTCNVTLSNGGDLRAATISHAGQVICLNPGNYSLGAANLNIPAGTTIQGLGASRDDVVVSSTAIRGMVTSDGIMLKNFSLKGGPQADEFGVLVAGDDNILWGLRIQFFNINIGVTGSDNVDIWDTFLSNNGNLSDGLANPNVWINNSNDVYLYYGTYYGRSNGPGGDGEVAAHNSTNVRINGTQSIDAGASSFYFVNCDGCEIRNAFSDRSDEWGLDVVQGSDNFVADGNLISNAYFGGTVFVENDSTGGTFTNNEYYGNNKIGGAFCNGINVVGSVQGVSQSGNTAVPGPVICPYP